MKPYIICHMVTSVDGRILSNRWHPPLADTSLYERLHAEIGGDAWLVGRVTGQEFAQRSDPYPHRPDAAFEREPWFARREAEAWGVVLDAEGKIAWGRADVGGDPLVVVLTRRVSDSHLAGLRDDGVSYLFAGDETIDLAAALDTLNRELGVERLLLEGGGSVNGSLLQAGLVDELSLVICPAIDGSRDAPSLFDVSDGPTALPISAMTLERSETLDGQFVWLRYRLSWSP